VLEKKLLNEVDFWSESVRLLEKLGFCLLE